MALPLYPMDQQRLAQEMSSTPLSSAQGTPTLHNMLPRSSPFTEHEFSDSDYQPMNSDAQEHGREERTILNKKNQKRHRLTHDQTRFLLNEFARDPHPDTQQRERLARTVKNLTTRQVQVWFQNRRAKLKRVSEEDAERILASRRYPSTHGPLGLPHQDSLGYGLTQSPYHRQEVRTEAVFAKYPHSMPSLQHAGSSSTLSSDAYSPQLNHHPHHMGRRFQEDFEGSGTASPISYDGSLDTSRPQSILSSPFCDAMGPYERSLMPGAPFVHPVTSQGFAMPTRVMQDARFMQVPASNSAPPVASRMLPQPATLSDMPGRGWNKSFSLDGHGASQTWSQPPVANLPADVTQRQVLPSISHELFGFLTAGTGFPGSTSEDKLAFREPQSLDFGLLGNGPERPYGLRADSLSKDPFTARLSFSFDSR